VKYLKFSVESKTPVGLTGCVTPSICLGPDGLARIAVSGGKVVRFARQLAGGGFKIMEVARADKFPGVVDVADGVSVASSTVADVVAGRCRTKGSGNDTYHGPWMTVIPAGASIPGPMRSMLFTTGGCRAIFDYPVPSRVELWGKDGTYILVDVTTGITVSQGKDSIGATGEKLAVYVGGWRAMNGCASRDDSRVMQRGSAAVTWLDADTYDVGADERYPGLAVKPGAVPVAYLASYVAGQMLVNKVRAGRAVFGPAKLRKIGPASRTDRHGCQLVPSKWRMAAFWTYKGQILGADVDAALAGVQAASPVIPGDVAAACQTRTGALLAVVKGGVLSLVKLRTIKVKG
jgi:hypothetical protein